MLEGRDDNSKSAARDFLIDILNLEIPSLCNQILLAMTSKLRVDKHFLPSLSFFAILAKSYDFFLNKSTACLVISSRRQQELAESSRIGTKRMSNFQPIELGHQVQILIDGKWTEGSIVKYNSLTGDILVEHESTATVSTLNTRNLDFANFRLFPDAASNSANSTENDSSQSMHSNNSSSNEFNIVIPSFKQETKSQIFAAIFGDYFDDDTASSPLLSAAGKVPKCSKGHCCEMVDDLKSIPGDSAEGDGEREKIWPICDGCKLSMSATNWNGSSIWRGWQCRLEDCNYNLCLNCFPEADGGPMSICFVGNSTSASALVYHSKSALLLTEVVGTVTDGSVIEVYDCINSSVYRLTNGMGYVGKHPVCKSSRLGGVWVKVAPNRYSSHILHEEQSDNPNNNANVNSVHCNERRLNLIAGLLHDSIEIDKIRKSSLSGFSKDVTAEMQDLLDYQIHFLRQAHALFELVKLFHLLDCF